MNCGTKNVIVKMSYSKVSKDFHSGDSGQFQSLNSSSNSVQCNAFTEWIDAV